MPDKRHQLLLGKWVLTHSQHQIRGEWKSFDHESAPCVYTFHERYFTVQGQGFFEEGEEIPYHLHPDHPVIHTPTAMLFINSLTDTEMELEEAYLMRYNDTEKMRTNFRRARK